MKVLIAYGSKYGATKKCAEKISKKINGEVKVVQLPLEKAFDLSQYDKVIIGGSIYAGSIQKEVKNFCKDNEAVLKGKKIGFFLSCMANEGTEKYFESSFPEILRNKAITQVACGGEYNFKKMNFLEKFIIKKIANSKAVRATRPVGEKVDGKTTINTISQDKINTFSKMMNEA